MKHWQILLILADFNLIYAGSRSIPWDPRSLKVSLCTGRLYHPIPMALLPPWAFEKMLSNNRHPLNKVQGDKWRLGLLKSSLITSKLAKGLSMDDKGASLEWNQETFPIECF